MARPEHRYLVYIDSELVGAYADKDDANRVKNAWWDSGRCHSAGINDAQEHPPLPLCAHCGAEWCTTAWVRQRVETMHRLQACFSCSGWLETLWEDAHQPDRVVILDGHHYTIGDEHATGMRGFGGARWDIVLPNGRRIVTTNLWHQGRIPDRFRARFPANARQVRNPVEDPCAL